MTEQTPAPVHYLLHASNFLPHQWEFISSKARIKALVAGFGSGKTHAFIYETLRQHVNNINRRGVSNGWIVYPTLDMAEELFIPEFTRLLTNTGIDYKYLQGKGLIKTQYGNIRLYSLQTPARMVGAELTFIGFDEFDIESPRNCDLAFNKALGRLRGSATASCYMVTTPEGFKSTYRLFVEENPGDRALFKAKTQDNPYLPPGYIDMLKKQYEPRLLKQYLEGEFVNLAGASAYHAFNRDTCLANTPAPPAGSEIWVGMDFNVNPMTAVCGYMQGRQLIVFDEIWLNNSHTGRMAEVLKTRFSGHELVICPDMTGLRKTTSSTAGFSDIDILKGYGFRVNGSSNPYVRDRLNTANLVFNQNKVLIGHNCKKLIRDLEQVTLDDHGEIVKTSPDLTHISDALGYLLWRCFGGKTPAWRW